MNRAGSDTGDGPAGAGPGRERSGVAGEDRRQDGHPPGRFAWWDPSSELSGLDPALRPVAASLARAVSRPRADAAVEEGIGVGLVEETPADPPELWDAVACLHRSLDRSRDEAPDEELAEARARLDEAAGRLWASAIEAELAAVRAFYAEVAHDLRSPLHSSLVLTDALFRGQSGPLTATQERQLSIVHSAMGALLRMSDDLLDFSAPEDRAGSHRVEETPFAPEKVAGDLRDLLEPITHHRRADLEVTVHGDASRVGDPRLLHRVLLNLATNGLEAVEEGGSVRLRIGGDDARLRATVEDDAGRADPERLRELLAGGEYTSVVRRLEGRTRGLGLVVSGRMVRAADGEIDVERTRDGWTRLTVTLPYPTLEAGG